MVQIPPFHLTAKIASGRQANYFFISSAFLHDALSYCSLLLLGAEKANSHRVFVPNRNGRHKKAERNRGDSRLSVFKGREASLNRAIFVIY